MALKSSLFLIWYRALAELKSEASRTYAGYLWWLFEPMMFLLVYYIVFEFIFTSTEEHFVSFLFLGIVIWRWFSSTVLRSANCLIANRGLIQIVNVHKIVFPTQIFLIDTIKFMAVFSLVLIVYLLAGFPLSWAYCYVPLLLLLQGALIWGCSVLAAALTPFFPDLGFLLMTAMQLMMFLSGIFYNIEKLSGKIRALLSYNPEAVLIAEFRNVIMYAQAPSWSGILYVGGVALLIATAGTWLISRNNKEYSKLF